MPYKGFKMSQTTQATAVTTDTVLATVYGTKKAALLEAVTVFAKGAFTIQKTDNGYRVQASNAQVDVSSVQPALPELTPTAPTAVSEEPAPVTALEALEQIRASLPLEACKQFASNFLLIAGELTKVPAPRVSNSQGITRPKSGTICAQVWEACDKHTATDNTPVSIAKLLADKNLAQVNNATLRTQYARWRAFNGIVGKVA